MVCHQLVAIAKVVLDSCVVFITPGKLAEAGRDLIEQLCVEKVDPCPSWKQPRVKLMVSLVNSRTDATRIGWHLWEIDSRFFPGLLPVWLHALPAFQSCLHLIRSRQCGQTGLLFTPEVDGFVPHTQDINLRIGRFTFVVCEFEAELRSSFRFRVHRLSTLRKPAKVL